MEEVPEWTGGEWGWEQEGIKLKKGEEILQRDNWNKGAFWGWDINLICKVHEIYLVD